MLPQVGFGCWKDHLDQDNQSISTGRRTISCKTGPFCNVSPSCCRLNWIPEKSKTARCCLRRLAVSQSLQWIGKMRENLIGICFCKSLGPGIRIIIQATFNVKLPFLQSIPASRTIKQNEQSHKLLWIKLPPISEQTACCHLAADSCRGSLTAAASLQNTKVLDTSGRLTWKWSCR